MFTTNYRRFAQLAFAAFIFAALAAVNAEAKQPTKAKTAVAASGLTRAEVAEAEQLLSDLGYWTGVVDGKFDSASRHALVAFQKVEGRATDGRLDREEMEALRGARRPEPLETGYAHVEVDIDKQVLFVVEEDGTVSKVLPVSTGNGEYFTSEGWTRRAVTPTGRFKVSRKIEGWRKAPLGRIFYPNYFLGGVAIHGSATVPAHPDSHGCVRIPVYAAKEFSSITPVGTVVLVHQGSVMAQGKAASGKGATATTQQR
jgi:peptidoglycan hydrolase-like protein with peptidoglycan-binding domain